MSAATAASGKSTLPRADVKECGVGFYPGVQIRRYNCGTRRLAEGYAEVEKCKVALAGTPCVTEA
jgi:hypothetical protein